MCLCVLERNFRNSTVTTEVFSRSDPEVHGKETFVGGSKLCHKKLTEREYGTPIRNANTEKFFLVTVNNVSKSSCKKLGTT